MKRIITLFLAAGLVFGASVTASAMEMKAKGVADFEFSWVEMDKIEFDSFLAAQRLRTEFNFLVNENLSGTLQFQIGTQIWGNSTNGASLGTNGVNIKTRRAYIDWRIPNTEGFVRMGLQNLALPSYFNSAVLYDNVAGITYAHKINNEFSLTAFWARPYDNDITSSGADTNPRWDEFDLFGLTLPITYQGFNVTPWFMYGLIGKGVNYDSTTNAQAGIFPVVPQTTDLRNSASAWWAGLAAQVIRYDPLTVTFDFNYGSVDQKSANKRQGWYAGAQVDYKLARFTPGIYAWYGSGDDKKVSNGSERLPNFQSTQWGWSSFGQNAAFGIGTRTGFTGTPAGNWGIGLQAADISFIEKLSHTIRVAYTAGTNSKNAPANYAIANGSAEGPFLYLTTKDNMIEVNFNSYYNIYDNLALALELAYADVNLSNDVWDYKIGNSWRAALNFQYNF